MTTAASKDLDDLSEDYYVTLHREVKAAMGNRAWPTRNGRPTKNGKRLGAPTKFSPDVAVKIVKHLANGGLMIDVAKELKTLPSQTWEWEQRYAIFAEAVARARLQGAKHWLEEAYRIADEIVEMEPKIASAMVQRQRLRVDTRIRLAGIFNPALSEKAGLNMNVGGDNIKVEIRTFVDPSRGSTDYLNGAPVERGIKAGPIAIEDQRDKT